MKFFDAWIGHLHFVTVFMESSTSLSSNVITFVRDLVIVNHSDCLTSGAYCSRRFFQELDSVDSKRDSTVVKSTECLSEVSVDLIPGTLLMVRFFFASHFCGLFYSNPASSSSSNVQWYNLINLTCLVEVISKWLNATNFALEAFSLSN